MDINIKKLAPDAIIPTYGTKLSAGADLYALTSENIEIDPDSTVFVRTGIAVEIPEGYVGLVFARSGLACKRDLAPANKVGVIDSDYRGEIMVAMHNHGKERRYIEPRERIAQLVITPCVFASFNEVEELNETSRGNKGFGSTGRK